MSTTTHHASRIYDVRGKMNLSKSNCLVMSVLNRWIVVIRERTAHESVREGRLSDCSKAEDGHLSVN